MVRRGNRVVRLENRALHVKAVRRGNRVVRHALAGCRDEEEVAAAAVVVVVAQARAVAHLLRSRPGAGDCHMGHVVAEGTNRPVRRRYTHEPCRTA